MRYFVFSIASSSTCFHYTKSSRKCKRFLCNITIIRRRICAFLTNNILLSFFRLVFIPYMLFPIFSWTKTFANTQNSVFHTMSCFYTYTPFPDIFLTWYFSVFAMYWCLFFLLFQKKSYWILALLPCFGHSKLFLNTRKKRHFNHILAE